MATVFKRPGKPNWFISWFEPTARGNKRKTKSSGTTCKRTSQRIANEIEAKAALRRSGIIDVVADELAKQSSRSIESHLADYAAKLKAAGRSAKHIDDTQRKVQAVAEFAQFETAGNITADGVNQFANSLKDAGRSARTIQSYLTAIKSLTRWMTEGVKLARDPLAGIRKPNPAKDRRLQRRFLLPDEWRLVQAATLTGPQRDGMSGTERALLYELAIVTGLRSGELRSLKRSSLDLASNPVVMCEAGNTKNKKTARQHIPSHLAERLRQHVARKSLEAAVFDMPHETDVAGMLRSDIAEARKRWLTTFKDDPDKYAKQERSDFLTAKNSKGESLDFHALRHTCGAWLMMAGVDIKTVQAVMRHSAITLTLDTYGHLMPGAESDAVADVDAMLTLTSKALAATGTDFQVQHRVQQLEHETLRIAAIDCDETTDRWTSGKSPKVAKTAGNCDVLRTDATENEDWGWRDLNPQPTDYESAEMCKKPEEFANSGQGTALGTAVESSDPALSALIAAWPGLDDGTRQAVLRLVGLE